MNQRAILAFLATFSFFLSAGVPSALGVLYDDFSGRNLDHEKWTSLEFVRKIENGTLVLETAAYESSVTNTLRLKASTGISYIEAKVKINVVEGDLRSPIAEAYSMPILELVGSFYNDGTSTGGTSQKGNVVATIFVDPNDAGALEVGWYVIKSANDAGTEWSDMAEGIFQSEVRAGEWHTLGLGFDPATGNFNFVLDETIRTWGSPDNTYNPPVWGFNALRTAVRFVESSTGLYGRISAELDEVVVKDASGNVVVTDDFVSPSIDPNKWSSYEFVRKISDGKLLSGIRSLGSSLANNLPLRNPRDVACIGAKVSLTGFHLSESGRPWSRRARLGGYFFNSEGDPNKGYQGDVWAEVYLGGTGSEPQAEWAVWKATNPEGTTFTTLAYGSFPLNVELGESYDLYIGWDGSSLTFFCNEYSSRYSPEGSIYEPNHNDRLLGTRIPAFSYGGSVDASITATFDDVTVNECPNAYSLSVSTSGSGSGVITSSPLGIVCGDDCMQEYKESTVVTLTATPAEGSVFAGWFGDCSSCGANTACGITMNAGKSCRAIFSPASGPDLTGSWEGLAHTCKNTRSGPKCKLSGTLRVENRGDQAAPPGALVYFYLSSDGTRDPGDTLLGQVAVGALKAGRSKTRKLSYALPLGESAQGKYVIAWIDATNAVAETNEANNIIVSEELQ